MQDDHITDKVIEEALQPLFDECVKMVNGRFGEFGSTGKFLLNLLEMDDYSFVINTHNLIEHFIKKAAIKQGLNSSIKNFERCGNRKRLDALFDSGYIPEYGYHLLLSFSKIRNNFVHNPQHVAQTFFGYLNSLNEVDQKELVFTFINAFFNSTINNLPENIHTAIVDTIIANIDDIPPEAIKLCLIVPILILAITTSSAKEHERTFPMIENFIKLAITKSLQDMKHEVEITTQDSNVLTEKD